MTKASGRWTWFRIAEAAILIVFTVLTVRNALVFPAIAGVDAAEHLRYARDSSSSSTSSGRRRLTTRLPGGTPSPESCFASGTSSTSPTVEQPVQLLSALAAVATAILLLGVVRHAFPG